MKNRKSLIVQHLHDLIVSFIGTKKEVEFGIVK